MERSWLILFCAGGILLPAAAHAEPPRRAEPAAPDIESAKDQARRLADEGQRLFEAGDYASAITRLREADNKFAAPTIKLAWAEAHEKLAQLVEARAVYRRIAAEDIPPGAPREFHDAQKVAQTAIARLDSAIPKVVVVLVGERPSALSVSLDGEAVTAGADERPVSVNPGTHVLLVEMPGRAAETLSVTVKEGETRRVEVKGMTLTPVATPVERPARLQRPVAAPAAAFALGGAGVLTGAIAGGIAIAKMSSFRERCGPELQCPASLAGELEDAKVAGHVATVGFAVGGVGAAMGALLLLWPAAKPPADQAPVRVSVSPFGVVVTGRF